MADETYRLKVQLTVLREIAQEYSGRTIDNVISNIEARIEHQETKLKEL